MFSLHLSSNIKSQALFIDYFSQQISHTDTHLLCLGLSAKPPKQDTRIRCTDKAMTYPETYYEGTQASQVMC